MAWGGGAVFIILGHRHPCEARLRPLLPPAQLSTLLPSWQGRFLRTWREAEPRPPPPSQARGGTSLPLAPLAHSTSGFGETCPAAGYTGGGVALASAGKHAPEGDWLGTWCQLENSGVTVDKLLCLGFPFCYREGPILLFTVSL